RGTSARSARALAMSCAAGEGSVAAPAGYMASVAQAEMATIQDILVPGNMCVFVLPRRPTPIPQLTAAPPHACVTFRLHLPETFAPTCRKDSTRAFCRHTMLTRLAPTA